MDIMTVLLTLAGAGILVGLIGNRYPRTAGIIAFLASFVPAVAVLDWADLGGFTLTTVVHFDTVTNITVGSFAVLHLHMTPLAWFFSTMIMGLLPPVLLFSVSYIKKGAGGFYAGMLFAAAGSLGVLVSADLLSLYIFWEIMSWSIFTLVIRSGERKSIVSYLAMGTLSAVSILAGLMLIYNLSGTMEFSRMVLPNNSSTLMALIFLVVGFAVKGALMPMHIWAPHVYSKSEEPFVAFLAGGMSKLGYYGMFLVMYGLVSMQVLTQLGTFRGVSYFGYGLAVIGAITAFTGTMLAVMEDDLRKLLAYSSIGQLGYIAIGIGIGTPLGIAGAFFQAFNHAFFKGVLFLAAGSVAYRTGKWKISELGGVAYRMPFTFLAALVAIFALAAIPITSGFAAKWLLYSAAIDMQLVFITPLMIIAGVGAFLYCFRILYGVFLGQPRHPDIKEAPISQLVAMWILVLPLMMFLMYPGKFIDAINHVLLSYGMGTVAHTNNVLYSGIGTYNSTLVIVGLIGGLLISTYIYLSRPQKVVPHTDNYMGAEPIYLHPDVSMHTASKFYQPVEDMLWPKMRTGAEWIYSSFVTAAEIISMGIGWAYRKVAGDYAVYTLAFLLLVAGWLLW